MDGNENQEEKPSVKQNENTRVVPWVKIILSIIVFFILIKLFFLIYSYFFSHKKSSAPPVPVVVSVIKEVDFPVYINALGTVTPTDTITVKTQINGQLLNVLYKEGQLVQQGELLAEIDPRPYEAQLIQLQGQLIRDQALLENARIDLARYEQLYAQDSISQQTLATQQSLVKQYEGTVQIDLGQIAATELNIFYTRISSPINGRVGLRLVDPGNFVQTTDTQGLFVLNAMQPITVIFPIPEDNLLQVMEQVQSQVTLQEQREEIGDTQNENDVQMLEPKVSSEKSNEINRNLEATNQILKVDAYDRTQNTLLSSGNLLTYDNQIDPTTGTIKLRAQFENKDNRLFPNQFVNIKLLVNILKNANVIPLAAVQRGAEGSFVYLVNARNKVEIRSVKVEAIEDDKAAVTGDIFPGEKVVIQGAEKLRNHSKVLITKTQNNENNNDNNLQDPMKPKTSLKNKSRVRMNYACYAYLKVKVREGV